MAVGSGGEAPGTYRLHTPKNKTAVKNDGFLQLFSQFILFYATRTL